MPLTRSFVRLLLSTFFTLLASSLTWGQINKIDDTTATPAQGVGHDYIKLLSETVNPANGSVSLRIQVPFPKGRGFTLPFSFAYDSNGVHHIADGTSGQTAAWWSNDGPFSGSGWSDSIPLASNNQWSVVNTSNGVVEYCWFSAGYMFYDPTGGRHSLGLYDTVDQTTGTPTCHSNNTWVGGDQRYYAKFTGCTTCSPANPSFIVNDRNGTLYSFPSIGWYFSGAPPSSAGTYFSLPILIEDRNGNRFSVAQNGTDIHNFTLADDLGRTLISSTTSGGFSFFGGGYQAIQTTTSANYSVTSTQMGSPSTYNCTALPAVNDSHTGGLSSITLPNNQQYQFYYGTDNPDPNFHNPYGLISEIIYPSGAWVKYTWKLSDTLSELSATTGNLNGSAYPQACVYEYNVPVVASRQVGLAGSSTPILTQTFVYGTTWTTNPFRWATKTTNVTTTDNVLNESFLTTYQYVSTSDITAGAGSYASLTGQLPVEASTKQYDWGNPSSPTTTVTKGWYSSYDPQCSFTTLDNGQTSGIFYDYYAYPSPYAGLLQDSKDYDFGQVSSPGSVCFTANFSNNYVYPTAPTGFARETALTYNSFFGALGSLFFPIISSITYNGSSTRVAETDFAYDQTNLSPVTALGHDDTNYGTGFNVRANLTTKTRKCFAGSTITPSTK